MSYSMIVRWLVSYLDYWVISIIQIEKTTILFVALAGAELTVGTGTTTAAALPGDCSTSTSSFLAFRCWRWESYEFKDATSHYTFCNWNSRIVRSACIAFDSNRVEITLKLCSLGHKYDPDLHNAIDNLMIVDGSLTVHAKHDSAEGCRSLVVMT